MARKLSSIYGQTLKSSSDAPGISTSKNLVIGSDRITSAVSATDFPLQVSAGAYISGSVGIGTINPTSKLHVAGDVNVSGVVTATSFFGDGSALTNLPGGGVNILFNDINIGTGITSLNFSGNGISSVTSNILGISTVTVDFQSNLDGGTPTTNYGGIDSIEGGSV